jgi:DNA-binding MarR family transcriptional regulator
MDVDFSLVSRALRDLKDNGIVVCENPEDRIGKLHKLTNLGLQIYEELNQE